jgi:hypothetical protein
MLDERRKHLKEVRRHIQLHVRMVPAASRLVQKLMQARDGPVLAPVALPGLVDPAKHHFDGGAEFLVGGLRQMGAQETCLCQHHSHLFPVPPGGCRADPVRVALIGAGKFGSMFLSQVPTIRGLEVTAIADLDPDRPAPPAAPWAGAPSASPRRPSTTTEHGGGAGRCRRRHRGHGKPARGHRPRARRHRRGQACRDGQCRGRRPRGSRARGRGRAAGVVYSMAYGDQPALVSEMVDWARAAGFAVTAAGKGTKYLPAYHAVTPDEVWTHYGLTPEEARRAGMNPQMFNSFLDGTKSAIEMVAIANACGLDVPSDGLSFPPCGVDDLAHVLRPRELGGQLEGGDGRNVSSLERDGRPVFRDLRWGVYVVLEAPNDYAAACFRQYGLPTDTTGRFAAMYKPFHLIGLELSISVLSAALRREATGRAREMRGTWRPWPSATSRQARRSTERAATPSRCVSHP